jgi:transcription antitermination protein NusB
VSARGKARRRALDVLFESEAKGLPLDGMLEERMRPTTDRPPLSEYAVQLVRGVTENRDRIDGLLSSYSTGWTLERMPAVDRNVLRIGVFEVLFTEDVPDAVAVSEALALVRELSTDESPAFVNGVLGSIVRDKTTLAG